MTEGVTILAVDPGTKTGWAHSCGTSGTWDLKVKKDESSGMRLIRLRGKLTEMKANVGVTILAYEANRYSGQGKRGSAQVVQSEFQALIKVWCLDNAVEFSGLSSSEIKSFATGRGNASKQEMIDAAIKKWRRPFDEKDNNEVDALWLLEFAKERFLV